MSQLIGGPGELPCGAHAWGDTAIDVPFLVEGTALRDALTGRRLHVGDGAVRVADALAEFPGALLVFDRGEAAA
jgi:maltooligosyltrehalose synthase